MLLISPGTRNSRAESNRLYGVGEFTSLTDGFKTNAVKRSTNKHRETKTVLKEGHPLPKTFVRTHRKYQVKKAASVKLMAPFAQDFCILPQGN